MDEYHHQKKKSLSEIQDARLKFNKTKQWKTQPQQQKK
jgi:hypothetical protein